eukprot:5703784-Alexandrium_andersonii.AAC.1
MHTGTGAPEGACLASPTGGHSNQGRQGNQHLGFGPPSGHSRGVSRAANAGRTPASNQMTHNGLGGL